MINYHTKVGNPVEELKCTRLWKRLNELNPDKANDACSFVEMIDPYLADIKKHFPLYTRHDSHHSYEVLNRMGDILMENLLVDSSDSLSDDEIYCLIVSAYAHDIGMVVFERGEKKQELFRKLNLPNDIEDDNEILTSYLRENHAERGLIFLRDTEISKFVPEYLRGLIGLIMKGHNMHPDVLFREIPDVAAIGRKVSNPVSLSIVLCCADALEFSDTRVIKSAYEEAIRRNDDAAQKSTFEMMKHKSIGCGISISKEGFIYATGEFENAMILHGTHKALDQIENWLKEYINYDKKQSRPFLKLHNPLIIRDSFTTNNFTYYPIAIKMDEFQIRELLTSKKMWGNIDSLPVKELIQNSIDACRYKDHIKPNNVDYYPKIEIIINNECNSISIIDNGIGMNEYDIINYFLQVGKSKTRSSDFVTNPINKGFSSLARYGIGFWSVFTIAKKAIINTKYNDFYKSENGIAFEVTIDPIMTYLELKTSNISEGTKIDLFLKDSIDISKVVSELINAITVSKIPCSIKNENDEVIYNYPEKLLPVTLTDIFDYKSKFAESKGMKLYSYEVDNDVFQLTLGITYSIINGEVRCLTPEGNSIFNYMPFNRGIGTSIITSICGLVTKFDIGVIPFAIGRVGKLVVDIKSPDGLEFSLSRRKLEPNEKLEKILSLIQKAIKEALLNFYTEIGVIDDSRRMLQIIDDSKSNGGNAGDTWISNLYNYYLENFKGLVPIKLLYWAKKDGKVFVEEKTMFIHEFWEIKHKVYYSCIWPEQYDIFKKKSFLASLVHSVEDEDGYVLWAYQEANAIMEVANSAKVINLKLPYKDWHQLRKEVIVLEPWKGYKSKNRELFEVKSRWTGKLLAINFERKKGSKPWYNFGRYIMYVDPEHELIKYLSSLMGQGKVWECGDILALMSENSPSSLEEIKRITSICPLYK